MEKGEEATPPPRPPPATGGRGQAVAAGHRHDHSDGDHGRHHHQCVQDPAREVRLSEEQPHVLERGRVVEDPGDGAQIRRPDVEVPVLLERGDEHPVKREPGKQHEAERRRVQPGALEGPTHVAARHLAPTSARRANRSIVTATTTRKGSRNTAIAAPCPRSAPRMPRWSARVGSTCVVLAGPPPVRMYTTPKSVAV